VDLAWLCLAIVGCGGPVQVSQSGRGAFEASLAVLSSGRTAVSWYDTRHGNGEIYARLLDDRGQPQGPEIRLTDDPVESFEPDIVAFGEDLVVAWYEKDANGAYQARLGRWSSEGRERWSVRIGSNSRIPVLRPHRERFFVAWVEQVAGETQVRSGWWSPDGAALTAAQTLGLASPNTWNLNAGFDDSGIAHVVYSAHLGTQSTEVFQARSDAETSQLTSDDGFPSAYPDIAWSGGRAAVTWFDERDGNREIYLFVGALSDRELDGKARRISKTQGESIGAYAAWNQDVLGLTWADALESQHEIFFQRFDSNGNPLARAIQVTHNPTDSLIPAIHPWKHGFALTWNELVDRAAAHSPQARSEIFATLP